MEWTHQTIGKDDRAEIPKIDKGLDVYINITLIIYRTIVKSYRKLPFV